jgi:hypothetical protein
MSIPAPSRTTIPEVEFSGRFVRAGDRRREILLTLSMLVVWLAGFALWVGVWRFGRWLGGAEGHLIRLFAFLTIAFHVVSLGIIRGWIDRLLSRLGR